MTSLQRTLAVLLAAALAACGAPPPGASAGGTRSADAANVAQQANEPRAGDPTAAHPTPMSPTPGNSATLGAPGVTAATPPPEEGGASSGMSAKGDSAEPARIGARHVLIQWMGSERAPAAVVRSREQALSVAQEVLRRARNKEDFARLAIEFSDEPGAGARGGSLGRFGHGQMVGAFEAAAFKLEVGQISDIVETPFGFHIIQRTE
ncbi:MAG: peptidylprolyl isomerase [Labilithrix sp.]|nr:peptidylprolyl isomerase [Labilithrix sp.]MCW5836344.1 peptidylprolyl isomerase [Labilithrix sp.]